MVTPRLGALAVLVRDGRVLLVQRRNPPDAGLWGFPGGHVEPGETALSAATRELHEETSVIAEPRFYLDNVDVILRDGTGQLTHHYLLAAVLCDYRAGEAQAGDDAAAARWFDTAEVLAGAVPMSAGVPDVLRAALTRA